MNFIEYESGNDESRLEALNSINDVKFSLKHSDVSVDDSKELLRENADIRKSLPGGKH